MTPFEPTEQMMADIADVVRALLRFWEVHNAVQ